MKKVFDIVGFISSVLGILSVLPGESRILMSKILVEVYWLAPIIMLFAGLGCIWVLHKLYEFWSLQMEKITERIGSQRSVHPLTKYCFFLMFTGFLVMLAPILINIYEPYYNSNDSSLVFVGFLSTMNLGISLGTVFIVGHQYLILQNGFYSWKKKQQLEVLRLAMLFLVIEIVIVGCWALHIGV